MKIKYLAKGIIKSIPGVEYIYHFRKGVSGINYARYCYSVWLRHLIYARQNGWNTMPDRIIELGPGNSLGVGIAALITGVNKYFAMDILKYSSEELNIQIFEELVALFRQKAAIPDEKEFPRTRPLLDDYSFPDALFSDERLSFLLSEERLNKIRNAIINMDKGDKKADEHMVVFLLPGRNEQYIKEASVDMIVSQAVLQHINNIEDMYRYMHEWLKPDGLMSHGIDFKCIGTSDTWFGHWTYSDLEWKIVKGRNAFDINREPYSTHIKLLRQNGFKIISAVKSTTEDIAPVKRLAKRFSDLSQEDLSTTSVFIQAIKEPLNA
jgi:hypothetical protein